MFVKTNKVITSLSLKFMKSKVLTVFSALFGLMFINSGLNKFTNHMPMPELPGDLLAVMMGLMSTGWLFPLLGIVEIIGGFLIVIPRYRALGAIVCLPVTVGILLYHTVNDPSTLVVGLILFLINVAVIVANWKKYLPMIQEVK